MGVYLPNMEMPRKGEMLVVFSDGTAYMMLNGMRERLPKTVAFPVPAHGRLIDADALKGKHHWTDDYYETEYVEAEGIDAAPTVIPAEPGDDGK